MGTRMTKSPLLSVVTVSLQITSFSLFLISQLKLLLLTSYETFAPVIPAPV